MQKKRPVTFKCDRDLLDRMEHFRKQLEYPATMTGLIETAMREMLERKEEPKRSARR